MNEIYTIGHSTHNKKAFLLLLKRYGINCVVDVRSMPYSKYSPQFNKEEIKHNLYKHAIYYIFMGNELGARREDKSLYTKEGYLDFEKTSKSLSFIDGINRVKSGIDKDYKIALMCTEKDPLDCHRNILVARQFYIQGYNVVNILENGLLETQEHLEIRLLDLYFPERDQISILDSENTYNEKNMLINRAYSLRNREIGYSFYKSEESRKNEIIYNRVY